MLTDHHCHLQDPKIFPLLHQALSNAKQNDICRFICCGTGEDDWPEVLDLSKKYKQIIPAIGIHPWFVEKISPNWQTRIETFLSENPECMVGEIGLDIYFCKETIEKQKSLFEIQLQIGQKYNRQVSIHNVRASHLLLPILKKYQDVKILLHSYSGTTETTKEFIEMSNVYFSFSGTILNSSKKLGKNIEIFPIERILLETDSPDLLPRTDKITNREYNEPANLIFILEKMAEVLKIDTEILEKQLMKNSNEFLGINKK